MFAAFVHIDNAHGCRAIIEEFGQIKEFEGVTLVTPVAGKIPRLLQRFERCFSTRQEAADWAAGEIETYAQKCLDQAAAIREEAVASERSVGV